MPIVVDSKEYSEYNTRTIRVKLGIPLRTRHLDGREVEVYRVLRLIVTERLYPVHRLTGEKFVRAWFQCAEVHYLNWLNGIHHQDLSLNNLMRRARDDDTICAVLNDWDLAIDAYEPQTCTGFEVTGTIPFMAIDLLREAALVGKVKHLYRHDLEAFFWIFIWVICCYKDGKRLDPLPQLYHEWTLGDMRLCRMGKNVLLAEVGWEGVDPTSTWVVEARIAAGLIQYLDKTQVARRSHKSPNDIGTKGRSKDAAQAAEDEEDEPEKVWNEFVEEMRDAGQSDPALGYILSLLTREWA
ncbi:hypothetical protein C8Q78DRAFT_963807 [Trametes maxima]|nr:hypothetical protein C8Q78DRAFT_963807 [Trametes maxima]